MKRIWAALLAATALVGCRSAQPTTNPFLRTTVPPPATAVVVPGEPFTPGVVTPAAPAAVMPVAPLAPPPVVAPPMVAPPRDKFSPPGGSFQYNQSWIDRSKGAGAPSVQVASYSQPSGSAPGETVANEARAAPQAAPALAPRGTPGNMIRILPPRSAPSADAVAAPQESKPSSSPNPLMRVTADDGQGGADDGQAEVEDVEDGSEAPGVRQVAASAPGTNLDATAPDDEEEESDRAEAQSADAQTASTWGGNVGYAFSPDYGWLRGRLEYSQISRQWKLRYIPIDGQTDQYGGSVKLPASKALASFKPGDMVAVRGSLAAEAAPSGSFAPQYVLAYIEPAVR